MKAIFVVAGHGISANGIDDEGAIFNGTTERKEVTEISQELIERMLGHSKFAMYELESVVTDHGDNVTTSKVNIKNATKIQIVPVGFEKRMSIAEKREFINSVCRGNGMKPADSIAVSIHINAAGNVKASGCEAWFTEGKATSKALAQKLIDPLAAATGFRNRGLKPDSSNRHGRLGILHTMSTSVLVECGFITNDLDARLLKDPDADDAISFGLYKGILAHFKLTIDVKVAPEWFNDVPDGVWYEADLQLCLAEELVQIPTHGKFNPTADSTRMVAMMARHLRTHHSL